MNSHEDTQCGNSRFAVNEHLVEEVWSQTDEDWSAASAFAVNTFHETAGWRSLQVTATTICAPSARAKRRLAASSASPPSSDVLQVTSIRVTHINGEPVRSFAGFTISYDQSSRDIVSTDNVPESSLLWPAHHLSPQLTSSSHPEHTQQLVSQEIQRLRDLEADLQSFSSVVEKQRVLVGDLTDNHFTGTKESLAKCERDLGCLVKTIAGKVKGCFHIIYLKYGPHKSTPAASSGTDCVLPTTREDRIDALVNNRPICVAQAEPDGLHSPASAETISLPGSSRSYWELPRSTGALQSLYALLVVIASFFCLTCVVTSLRRRCCSPRARAERAARREERLARRQYRDLARRKAWKDWWAARLRCNSHPASTDYEEKRALILQQESVLEAAMQREVRALANSHCVVSDMVAAAEEGRADINPQPESLPAYRSRAGSGRPPSYREIDPNLQPQMSQYSAYSSADSSIGSDVTPDSSIANLSPRNSSETLRTERSGL